MTKTELWASLQKDVSTLIDNSKVSKDFANQLLELLENYVAPKSGGGSSQNPPQMIDGVMNYYCRFHQAYYPEDKMVMSNGKSKGYCKAAISTWNKRNSAIKKSEALTTQYILNGDMESATLEANKTKELKAQLNDPESFNAEQDWADFSK